MRLEHLLPGQRFRLAALPERTGTLLRVGPGSAVVRYDGSRHRHVEKRRGTELVAQADFDVPLQPVTVSLHTDVEQITETRAA